MASSTVQYGTLVIIQEPIITATQGPCVASYEVQLPVIAGATGYTWAIYPNYGYSAPPNQATITGSARTGTNEPNPPRWQMTPINTYDPATGNGTRLALMVGIDYQAVNVCGTGDYASSNYSLFLRASLPGCYWRPAPGGGTLPPALLTVSPVPADDQMRLSWAATGKQTAQATVELLDVYGQVRLTQQSTVSETNLATGHLPAGPYLLRVRRGDVVETRRVAVQH